MSRLSFAPLAVTLLSLGLAACGGSSNVQTAPTCVTGASCVPTNPCQVGVVSCPGGENGTPVCDPKGNAADGTACNDNDKCTQTDTCQNGTCKGSNPVVCAALDQCHDVGLCNPATGACSNPEKANGTACNDGNACSQTDTCQGGACVGSNPVACNSPGQCETGTGTCVPASGLCVYSPKANGTACNDGNACTDSDACQAGVCTGAAVVTCAPPNQCQASVTCDPVSGCTYTNKANGTSCDDGNACTVGDTCQGGVCAGGTAVTCNSPNQCETGPGTCNTANGQCSYTPKANGAACNDGNACTSSDACNGAGLCVGGPAVVCAAPNQCQASVTCDAVNGCVYISKANGTVCDDANPCTTSDTCQGGVCTGGPLVACNSPGQCETGPGTCNAADGKCSYPPKANGTACNDADKCTNTDTCDGAGTCVGSNPVVCTAQDQCHSIGLCDKATGVCTNPVKGDGVACNDGNACTQTDTCQAGVCTGSNPKVCTKLDQCHAVGVCAPATGICSDPPVTDGTDCTGPSNACYAGVCVAVSTVNLDMVDYFWPDSGPTPYAYGDWAGPPEAFIPTAAGYSIRPGVTAPDFLSATISKVPVGNYLLYTGPRNSGYGAGAFFNTAARQIDLGADELGRTNWTNTSAANTKLSFVVTGLQSWDQTSDIAIMACSNVAQSWNFDLGFTMGAAGGTYTTDWQYKPAIKTGDTAFLYQLHTVYPTGAAVTHYRVATRAVQLPSFEVAEGVTTSVNAAMATPVTSATALVDWKTTQFEAALAAGNAGLPVGQHYFGVLAVDSQKGSASTPPYFPATARLSGVDLINIEPKEGTVVADVNLGTVGYYRFMPTNLWQDARRVVYRSFRTFNVAPSTWPTDLHVGIYQQEPMTATVASSAATPVLNSPSNPTFSGKRTAPLLSWTAPTIGAPTSYLVDLLELYPYDTGTGTEGCTPLVGVCATAYRSAGTFYTTETKIQLPDGLLATGKSYVAMIAALVRNPEPLTISPKPAPRRHGVGFARADVLTGIYVP